MDASDRPLVHQVELDDETQPYESTINRKIGSGHMTTNALVLPTIPERDIRGALTGGGEIMLTGLDRPARFPGGEWHDRPPRSGWPRRALRGRRARAGADRLQPVRAVRAISTHATGQGITHTQKPKGNRVLTGLLIAASGMASSESAFSSPSSS